MHVCMCVCARACVYVHVGVGVGVCTRARARMRCVYGSRLPGLRPSASEWLAGWLWVVSG